MPLPVAPGTIVVVSDIGCPWAHVAVARLWAARERGGLSGELRFDHWAFPLEEVNQRPTPKDVLDAEVPVAGAAEPGAGWQTWQGPAHMYPVTTLPALEAVQAAKEQGLSASESLDRALRIAFFGESRCISLRSVIIDVARGVDGLDSDALALALDDGRARHSVIEQWHAAVSDDGVKGSPHLFLPDGSEVHNPGIEMHWQGEHGEGFPVIDSDDPAVYDRLIKAALA